MKTHASLCIFEGARATVQKHTTKVEALHYKLSGANWTLSSRVMRAKSTDGS
jgi:hypothetical protein